VIYRRTLRPALFTWSRADPECAHELAVRNLARISRHPALVRAMSALLRTSHRAGAREVFGVRFPGPVGLAAGFDKNGAGLPALAALGFGFLEAGTVTRHAQPGHPRPRTWRYARRQSLVNAMGFPNNGAATVAAAQRRRAPVPVPVGWNVSKSMTTPVEEAAQDICESVRLLHPFADFFIVNVSSPNTPGLRRLEGRDHLEALLRAVGAELDAIARPASPRPLLVKISPDLTPSQLDDVVDVALATGIAGIVATNTSVDRRALLAPQRVPDRGGVSGRALADRSLVTVRHLAAAADGRLAIVGAGGIDSPDAAQRMLDAGASLVEVYTGLIYQGPSLVRRIDRRVRDSWLRGRTTG
jgi:dihydroorotate dehydrogenase